jgi:hypothetical protein
MTDAVIFAKKVKHTMNNDGDDNDNDSDCYYGSFDVIFESQYEYC